MLDSSNSGKCQWAKDKLATRGIDAAESMR